MTEIFIPTAWGGAYITIEELIRDILLFIVLYAIGMYVNKKMKGI